MCSLIALLQQSADIVLIEEERTLFSTADPYQDIKDLSCELGHSGRMENSKVKIFHYELILSKCDRTRLFLIALAGLVFLAAGE